MQNELMGAIYSVLSSDSTLLNSGINPTSGASRSVSVVGQGETSTTEPFVRITLTDSSLVDGQSEPHDYTTQPTAERARLLVNVFSDFEPEVRKIVARLTILLRHRQIVTTNFNGSTWLESTNYYSDNVSDPKRIVRVAAMRVRCTMEPS